MSSDGSKTILGLICRDGIVLAINGKQHSFFYLNDSIFFCSANQLNEREAIIDICRKLEVHNRNKSHKMTVAQIRDMMTKDYKRLNTMELLLAGLDSKGLHLFSFQPLRAVADVQYAVLGERSEEIEKYLQTKWQANMSLKRGEKLARKAFHLGLSDELASSKMEIGLIFMRLSNESEPIAMETNAE